MKLEHFALRAQGGEAARAAFEAKLTAAGETFRRSDIESFGISQYNIWDPDGTHIHVDFVIG